MVQESCWSIGMYLLCLHSFDFDHFDPAMMFLLYEVNPEYFTISATGHWNCSKSFL